MIDYTKQKIKDLKCLIEMNTNKIDSYKNDKNKPPFITGLIKELKKQNLELKKIITNKK